MAWVWDERKAAANEAKHGIPFEFAINVFDDPMLVSFPALHPDGDRWLTLGMIDNSTLAVVHTLDEPNREFGRVISARRATAAERKRYAKGALS